MSLSVMKMLPVKFARPVSQYRYLRTCGSVDLTDDLLPEILLLRPLPEPDRGANAGEEFSIEGDDGEWCSLNLFIRHLKNSNHENGSGSKEGWP